MGTTTGRKVTICVDEQVLRAARARVDKPDSQIAEVALRAYLVFDLVERVWDRSDLSEAEATRLAVEETRALRAEKGAAAGS